MKPKKIIKIKHITEPGKRQDHLFRPQSRHYNDLLDRVRDFILTTNKHYITKEELAIKFKAKDHEVEQCFHKLNLEGLLSQGHNAPPHDSKREMRWGRSGMYSRSNPDWGPTTYTIRHKEAENMWIKNESGDTERMIKGRLFLSNINKTKLFDDKVVKLYIAREPIKNMEKYGFKWITKLVPPYDLWYDATKKKINWAEYYRRYKRDVILNPKSAEALDIIFNHLKAGEDIVLICYCAKSDNCHRSILGEYFSNKGVQVINLDDYDDKTNYGMYNIFTDLPINPGQKDKIIKELLIDKKYNCKLLEQNTELNNTQLKIIVDFAINNTDEEVAKLLLEKYNDDIKTKLQDQLDGIMIIKKLMNI